MQSLVTNKEKREVVASCAGAQHRDISGNRLSDWGGVELFGQNPQLEAFVVSRLDIDTPFSLEASVILKLPGSAENPFLLDDEEKLAKSPSTAAVSETSNRTLHCCKLENLEEELKMFVIMFTKFFSNSITVNIF